MTTAEPDIRPLGYLAVGLAALSLLFAYSYFFSFLAYLAGPLALVLGVAARTDVRTRTHGTVAVVVAIVAVVWTTVVLFALY